MSRVWFVHALRNALIPHDDHFGTGRLFLACWRGVVTETVFTWPGMGRLALDARSGDYPMLVLGSGHVLSVFVILGNFAIGHPLRRIVDPRFTYPNAGPVCKS
ncbi:MAG: hypothetical protein R2911_13850 [Caldilineaceae bacterium]